MFAHYKPGINLETINEQGKVKLESIPFYNVTDFTPYAIIAKSTTLNALKNNIQQFQEITKQLKKNKALFSALSNSDGKSNLVNALEALVLLLEEALLKYKTKDESINEIEPPHSLKTKGPNIDAMLFLALESLAEYGGFDLLESAIPGVNYLNPEHKARKMIFLEDAGMMGKRQELCSSLRIWINSLRYHDKILDIISECDQKRIKAENLLNNQMRHTISLVRDLEGSYRSLNLFYKNTEESKVKNVFLINATPEQLTDLENNVFTDNIKQELRENYDRLDLRSNYSLLIIPGFLGSNKVVEKWAKIAFETKVMMITDFANLNDPIEVMDQFEEGSFTGGDNYRSNVIMTCNWLLGRNRYVELGEEEDMYLPPALALGGKLYNSQMSQVTAGKKFGGMNEVDGVRFSLKKSEISVLEKIGLVPMVQEYGKVIAFSAKTLFNGDNLGLQTYSVVRIFDYISKVLIDFLNRRAFENFSVNSRKDLMSQIVNFLDRITGPTKLMESFIIVRFENDPNQKDIIYFEVSVRPYFPAKTFLIKLKGQKGDDGQDWASEYLQQ
ncbi:MAG: type VI secretion system contractile sheath protein TssC [Ferruginibacter sp.]